MTACQNSDTAIRVYEGAKRLKINNLPSACPMLSAQDVNRAMTKLLVTMLALSTSLQANASPSPGPAETHKTAAFRALAKRDYAEGIAELQKGYDANPDVLFLYNIAVAYDKWSGHCEDAGKAYRRYLELCTGCDDEPKAKDNLALLTATCPALRRASKGVETPRPKKQSVEGWAEVRGDLREAREAAIQDALAHGVQMIAGVEIASLMGDNARSSIHDNRERFEQEVESQIHAQSVGFVTQYSVLSEKHEGQLYKVVLIVEVDSSRVRDQLERIAQRIAEARHPKILVLSTETYKDGAGETHTEQAPLRALLESAFVNAGFELVNNGERFDGSEEAGVNIGRNANADYLVIVNSSVSQTGFNRLKAHEYYADVAIAARILELPTRVVVGNVQRAGSSPSSVFSEADLVVRTTANIGDPVAKELVNQLLAAFDKNEKSGQRFHLVVRGVNTNDDRAGVLDVVKRQRGAAFVKELTMKDGVLEIELRFPSAVDASVLRQGILKDSVKDRRVSKLSLTEFRGNDMFFSLGGGTK